MQLYPPNEKGKMAAVYFASSDLFSCLYLAILGLGLVFRIRVMVRIRFRIRVRVMIRVSFLSILNIFP